MGEAYLGMTHRGYYNALMAGDPERVKQMAASWSSVAGTILGISTDLASCLSDLSGVWSCSSSEEFQRRITLITNFAAAVADHQYELQVTVNDWGTVLANAQAEAEPPDEVAAEVAEASQKGSWLPGVLGSEYGHAMADEAAEAARQRMANLVSEVGLVYGYTSSIVPEPVVADPDMPGDDVAVGKLIHLGGGSDSASSSSSAARTVSSMSASGSASPSVTTVSYDGGSGSTTSGTDSNGSSGAYSVSTLAGADGAGVVGLASGTGAAVVTSMSLGAAGVAGPGGMGLPAAAANTTIPPGGVLASANPTGAKSVNPTVTETGTSPTSTTRTGTPTTTRTDPTDDEDKSHSTWLTEDDMVWGDEEADDLPPSVLG